MTNLAVLTAEQHKGVARQLLQEMLQREKANQAHSDVLELHDSQILLPNAPLPNQKNSAK